VTFAPGGRAGRGRPTADAFRPRGRWALVAMALASVAACAGWDAAGPGTGATAPAAAPADEAGEGSARPPCVPLAPAVVRAAPSPGSPSRCAYVEVGGEHVELQVIPAAGGGAPVAWVDPGGPGLNVTGLSAPSFPAWLRSYTIVAPIERWVSHRATPSCRDALDTHIRAVLGGAAAPGAGSACGDDRPWSTDEYGRAVLATVHQSGGLDLVLASSFGAARMGPVAADVRAVSPARIVLADPAPPPGTGLVEVARGREAGVRRRLTGAGLCDDPCAHPDARLLERAPGRLAALYATYTREGTDRLRAALAGDPASLGREVDHDAHQAAFVYGTGQAAPGLVAFTGELCRTYRAGSPVDGASEPFARAFLDLVGPCGDLRPGDRRLPPLPPGTCLLVNADDPVSGSAADWEPLTGDARVVPVAAGVDHGASLRVGIDQCPPP
jgi:hypothetical protein